MSSTCRRHLAVGFVTSCVLALFMQFLEFKGTFANAEGSIADIYLTLRPYARSEPRVVTIGISEDDYRDFFGATSPLDPPAVTSLVEAIRGLKPLVVGVDLITDSTEYLELTDRPTGAATDSGATPTPVVWAAGGKADIEPATFLDRVFRNKHDVLIAQPGNVRGQDPQQRIDWGLAVFATDEDGVVRRLLRKWHRSAEHDAARHDPATQEPTFDNVFARAVAERYCLRAEAERERKGRDGEGEGASCAEVQDSGEAFMAFGDAVTTHDYAVSELFQCTDRAPVPGPPSDRVPCRQWAAREGTKDWSKSVVLLGGTFPEARDVHETPRGPMSGLALNATAVRAEIFGGLWRPFGHLWSFLFDILIGMGVTVSFLVCHSLRWKIGLSAILAPAGFVAAVLLVPTGILWAGWVGMLLTGVPAHIVIETWLGAGHGAAVPPAHVLPESAPVPENGDAAMPHEAHQTASAGAAEVAGAAGRGAENNLA